MVNILLVVGHPFIRKMLKSQIEIEPDMHIIAEAIDGPSAFEQARLTNPDLIILDYDMPHMDGLKLITEFHNALPSIPVILLGLSDDEVLRFKALSAGAAEFVTKELNTNAFLAAIRRAAPPPK
jgi:DNA-binding NarL/FixJ family response regulator